MATADIYRQYLTDYEDAAKKYNRGARAYQNALQLTGGPIKAKDSNTGQELGLYSKGGSIFNGGGGMGPLMPNDYAVKTGTYAEYKKAAENSGDGRRQGAFGIEFTDENLQVKNYYNAKAAESGRAFGLFNTAGPYQASDDDPVSWEEKVANPSGETRNIYGQQFADVGNGYYAGLKGGVGTGKFTTSRLTVSQDDFKRMQESGQYKDLKVLNSINDESGESYLVDATYEQMRMPQRPGEFNARKPSLSIAQMREIQNPTPTMAEAEREGVGEKGLIEAARSKFLSAKPGLISASR